MVCANHRGSRTPPRWGDYLAQDLVDQADATFRTVPAATIGWSPDYRWEALARYSLLQQPNLFRVVAAHSPSVNLDDGTFPMLGSGLDFARREPLKLAELAPGIEDLDIWIDAGDQDPWLERDQMLHQTLVDRGIVHHWSVLPGGSD